MIEIDKIKLLEQYIATWFIELKIIIKMTQKVSVIFV